MLNLLTAGESHGPGLTCIVEGLPAGLELDQDALNRDLARRQLGHGRGGRMKIERDRVQVTGGVRHGHTLGGPIALQVANRDYANWEERMNPWPVEAQTAEVHLPRPGHADLAGTQKYGLTDVRDVLERASARETAARVAGGAVAKAFLATLGVSVFSHVLQIAAVTAPRREDLAPADFAEVDESPVRCLDPEASRAMVAEINRLRKANESLGGIFEVRGFGVVPGLGSHVSWRERLDGVLGQAVLSIQSVKAVSIGDGLEVAGVPGSQAHDEIFYDQDARLLAVHESCRRPGGGDDHRRAGRRPRGDEAVADPDQAAAFGGHLHPRTRRGAAGAHGLVHGARRWRGRRGDGGLRARRCLPAQVRRRSHRRRARGAPGLRGADRVATELMAAGAQRRRAVAVIGFMGAGKSTAAAGVAEALGTSAIDVDAVIEERLGKPIERIFAEDGEAAFRGAEETITLELLSSSGSRVIALGGGAVGSAAIRTALADHLVVWIDIDVETAWTRSRGSGRPLAGDRARFERLYGEREPVYDALADIVVPHERAHRLAEVLDAAEQLAPGVRLLWAASASGDYPAYIGPGLLGADPFWPAVVTGRRFLVTDGRVGRLYGERLAPVSGQVMIMPGEQSKTIAHAEIVWSELARAGMTRADVVVALGGGVVGDLAGFCAATYQRGVRYVQVPTTLVAQVDSAYGGKTGVDLEEAKNYVGAYHQPQAVIADPHVLTSLEPEELAAGYAEVVKTALIAGGRLWDLVRGGADPTDPRVIAACAQTKLRIVARDERDDGLRQALNLGHTVGHAIETVTGYATYRHGEAVALGLLAALRLSGQDDLRQEVAELLAARRLPVKLDQQVDPDAVVMATARDKKRVGEGAVPFVLLAGPGRPEPGRAVASRELIAAVRELAG